MKRTSEIVISFTVLILLMFGTGGLSLEKCSCSGKVRFVLPADGPRCPKKGSCMTVKIWKVSDAAPVHQKTVCQGLEGAVQPVAVLPEHLFYDRINNHWRYPAPPVDSRPPGRTCTSVTILRV